VDSVSIPLANGKGFAVIDAADYDLVVGYRWYLRPNKTRRYATASIPGEDGKYRSVQMHRLLLNAPAPFDVDHRNGDGLDNRRVNLRLATRMQNSHNRRKYKITTSKYRGVWYDKSRKKWRAQIMLEYRSIYIGQFATENEAARAYDETAKRLLGEFTRPNFQ
jgi:hypothetical protein